jgi:hypothetical protein
MASSLVGWRILACFAKVVMARAGEREVHMPRAIERQHVQTAFDLPALASSTLPMVK